MPHPIPNPDPQGHQVQVQFFIPETPLSTDRDGKRSKAEGRPIYKTQEYVRVLMPANPKSMVVALAHEKRFRNKITNEWLSYAEAFPEQYRMFKDGMAEQLIGTPLTELPGITAAKRAELKALKIMTVEQLSTLDSHGLKRLGMEGTALKSLATSYLARAKGMALDARHAAENAALKAAMDDLKAQLELIKAGQASAKTGEPETDENLENPAPVSTFADWTDDEMKNFIKQRTGEAPRGRISRETLIERCDNIVATEDQAIQDQESVDA